MVEVTFHAYPDGRMGMRVRGHAGFGQKGQDIVCAAVSILTLTAARETERMYENGFLRCLPETVLREGFASVTVCPRPRFRRQVRIAFGVVHTGMRLLAQSYPRHVRLKGRI